MAGGAVRYRTSETLRALKSIRIRFALVPRRARSRPSPVLLVIGLLFLPLSASSQVKDFGSIEGLTPLQQAIADGTDAFCDGAAGAGTALNGSLCGSGFRGGLQNGTTSEEDATVGLQQLGFEEILAQGSTAVDVTSGPLENIGARLAALHGGVTGRSLRSYTLHRPATPFHPTLVASLLPYAVAAAAPANPPVNRRFGVFANGTFTFGDKDPTDREAGFDFETFSVSVGADYKLLANFILGLALSYASTEADLTGANDTMDSEGFSVALYGTYMIAKQLYVDLIANFGWSSYDSTRTVLYSFTDSLGRSRTVDQTMNGETDGTHYAISIGLGYDLRLGGLTVTPFGRLHYVKLNIDAFREEATLNPGNDETAQNLDIGSQEIESLSSVLGFQLSYAISTGFGILLPRFSLDWEHEYQDDAQTLSATYVEDPGGTPLVIPTDSPDRDFFNLGAGITAVFATGISVYVYYETVLGLDHVAAHHVALGVRGEL